MAKVKGDKLSEEITKALDEYQGLTYDALKRATDKTARETVNTIKGKAPKKTGRYQKGWSSSKTMDSSGKYGRIIHNKRRYQLTHLLEHGHALKGYIAKRTTKTHVKAFPHIPSDDETEKLFETNLRKEMEKL